MRTILSTMALLFAGTLLAAVPKSISYQGRLTEGGQPVADGSYLVKFIIYDAPSGGTILWNGEFQTVSTVNGLFTAQLGAPPMGPLPATLFDDTLCYVGITVGVNPEATPRTKLVTVPYAFHANTSDNAGVAGSADAVAWSNISGMPAGFADNIDNDAGGDITGVTAGTGLSGGGSAGSVTLSLAPVIASNHTFDGTVEFGDSTMKVTNYGVSIGSAYTLASALMYLRRERNTSDISSGLSANLDNSGSGTLYGANFTVGSTDASDGGGTRYGVHATVNNALSSTSSQMALWGVAGSSSKTAGTSYGVRGQAYAGTGSTAYGVYGFMSGTGSGYAGWFQGNVHVANTLSKAAGSFKIDHPLDPANKYLQHSFVESPDMMNIYNGNVVTNASGTAVVTMPSYFEALNTDFRYQLTVIGQFAQAIITSEISGSQFTIQTDKPNVKVSWQVTGIRHDAYANAHRIEVEVDKPANERGTYLAPEEHGQPIEKHVNYEQMKEAEEHAAETDRPGER